MVAVESFWYPEAKQSMTCQLLRRIVGETKQDTYAKQKEEGLLSTDSLTEYAQLRPHQGLARRSRQAQASSPGRRHRRRSERRDPLSSNCEQTCDMLKHDSVSRTMAIDNAIEAVRAHEMDELAHVIDVGFIIDTRTFVFESLPRDLAEVRPLLGQILNEQEAEEQCYNESDGGHAPFLQPLKVSRRVFERERLVDEGRASVVIEPLQVRCVCRQVLWVFAVSGDAAAFQDDLSAMLVHDVLSRSAEHGQARAGSCSQAQVSPKWSVWAVRLQYPVRHSRFCAMFLQSYTEAYEHVTCSF